LNDALNAGAKGRGEVPELQNKRREKFAQLIAYEPNINKGEAYILAGYQARDKKNASTNGGKLSRDPMVEGRILELRADASEKAIADAAVDQTLVLGWLKDNYRLAKTKGNFTAANRSAELIGKELGMFADKLQLENLDDQLAGKGRDELRLMISQVVSEVGMRVVDMNDESTRDFIIRNAERVGLIVFENGERVKTPPLDDGHADDSRPDDEDDQPPGPAIH
jgi:hypothetical protein